MKSLPFGHVRRVATKAGIGRANRVPGRRERPHFVTKVADIRLDYSVAGKQSRSGHESRIGSGHAVRSKEKEGTKNKEKALSLNDTAQTIDPSEGKEVNPHRSPSPSKSEKMQRATVTKNRTGIQTKRLKSLLKPSVTPSRRSLLSGARYGESWDSRSTAMETEFDRYRIRRRSD